jgi:hypothetical protein
LTQPGRERRIGRHFSGELDYARGFTWFGLFIKYPTP